MAQLIIRTKAPLDVISSSLQNLGYEENVEGARVFSNGNFRINADEASEVDIANYLKKESDHLKGNHRVVWNQAKEDDLENQQAMRTLFGILSPCFDCKVYRDDSWRFERDY